MVRKNKLMKLITRIKKSNIIKVKDEKVSNHQLVPKSVDMSVTFRCNSRCVFCSSWKNKSVDLEFKYIEKFLTGLKDWLDPKSWINIVGGEPTMRNDLEKILRLSTNLGLNSIVTTNGYRLASKSYAKRLISRDMKKIVFSLEGFEKTNDKLRGRGAFKRTIRGIKNVREIDKNVRMVVQSVITAKNIDELPDFITWLYEKKYTDDFTFQAFSDISNSSKEDWWKHSALWPRDLDMLNRKIDEIIKLKKLHEDEWVISNPIDQLLFWKSYFKNPKQFATEEGCNIGDFHIAMAADGNILICPFKSPVGNIKEKDLKELFYSPKANLIRKSIYSCNDVCHFRINCRYKQLKIKQKV